MRLSDVHSSEYPGSRMLARDVRASERGIRQTAHFHRRTMGRLNKMRGTYNYGCHLFRAG